MNAMNWRVETVFRLLILFFGVCSFYGGAVEPGKSKTQLQGSEARRNRTKDAATYLSIADFGRSVGAAFDPLQPVLRNLVTSTTTPITERIRFTDKTNKKSRKKSKQSSRRWETERSGIDLITPPTASTITIGSTTIRRKKQTTLKPKKTLQQLPKALPKPFKNISNTNDHNHKVSSTSQDSSTSLHNEVDENLFTRTEKRDVSTHHARATEQPVHATFIRGKPLPTEFGASPYVCNISSMEDLNAKRLCGYPTFYNTKKCSAQFCSDAILSACENKGTMITFGASIVLLGVFIVVANSLLPYLVYRHRCLRNRHNYIKASLAFADILKGILVCSVVPNIFWFHNLSEKEVVEVINDGRDSAIAVILGALLIASSQSSTLHLMFLTLERFAAFKSPMRHNSIRTATIGYILVGVWFISIVFSFLPVIFPHNFEYAFFPVIFVYMLSSKSLPDNSSGYHGIFYCCLTILLPYVVMVVFSIWTGFVVSSKLHSCPGIALSPTSPSSPREGFFGRRMPTLTPEFTVFKTLIIMIVAFSLTLVPVIVVIFLYNIGYYHCGNYALPYTLAFYASISNSFVNVIIYTARDEKFREALMSEISRIFGHDETNQFAGKRKMRIFSTSSNLP